MRLHYGVAGPGHRGLPGDRSGRRPEGPGAEVLTTVADRNGLRPLPPPAAMAHRVEAVGGPARPLLSDPALRHRRPARRRRHRPQPHEPLDARAPPFRDIANICKERFPGVEPLRVVLAYDVRQFEDQRRQYNPALPNPVLHLSSRDLAQHAAGVYAANGIHAHILPPDSKHYLATPELSFTIRYLQAHGGLNSPPRTTRPTTTAASSTTSAAASRCRPTTRSWPTSSIRCTVIKSLPWPEAQRSRPAPLPRRGAAPRLHRPVPQAEPGAAAEARRLQGRLHAAARRRRADRDGDARRPGLPRRAGRRADDARRPVPQRHQDAEPGSARVDGPRRGHGPRAQAPTWCWPPTPTPTASARWSPTEPANWHVLTGNEIAALLTHFKLNKLTQQGRLAAVADRRPHRGHDRPGHAHRPPLQGAGRRRSAGRLQVHRRCAMAPGATRALTRT